MNCKDIDELMTAYLDGEVAHEKQEQIEAHISTCPHCREELKTLSATQDNLRLALKSRAARSTPSPNVWERILKRIKTEERPVATFWRPLRTRLKAIKDIVAGIMFLRQPIWRTTLIVLALVLVMGLSVMLPSFLGQDKDAMAAEGEIMQILKSDSRTKALLDDGATVSFLEDDYTGGMIARLEETIDMMEDTADMTVIAYEIDIAIMAQRMLVEIALGDKYYMADVDVKNGKVLSFGEKGDPEFRTIYPRFDVDVSGEILNEGRETFPFIFSYGGGRGFEGIESYIDPFYEKSIFFTVNYQSPLMPLE